jgi:anti-sigma B factor antagonist
VELTVAKHAEIVVVHIPLEVIDAKNAKEFRDELQGVINENKHIIFDMSQVGFLDSSGCGAILSCLRQLNQKGGDLKMCGVQSKVRTLFELIRMHRIIEIFETERDALQSF